MAMLTAERPWKYIDNSEMKDKINKAFKDYDAEALINADPEILEQDIRDIKAGNRRIRQQTKALKHNIKNLQTYEEENESIDKEDAIDKFYRDQQTTAWIKDNEEESQKTLSELVNIININKL